MSAGKNTGGPAFARAASEDPDRYGDNQEFYPPYDGMTLLDYFAIHIDSSEIEAIVHSSLSFNARELIVGRKFPVEPPDKAEFPASILSRDHDARMQYQLAVFEFNAELRAKLRYKMAGAMLAAREAA